ncbi:MAG: polysaccharide biosynthesis C-terminal domain-containing protein [Crocinitomicaceae bacterium]|nr:polysaccharide biosynthesis C-terminal domain-containing protein [Crocinitomicaceae bacterium]
MNLIIKPLYILGIDAEVQNRLGASLYGNYFALLNYSLLLNILNDLGLSNYFTRKIANEKSASNPDFFSILGGRILLFLIYAAITLGMAAGFGFVQGDLSILAVLVLNQLFVASIQYARATLSGLLRFKTDAVFSILDRSLLILMCLYLLWGGGEISIWAFVLAQSVAYGFTAILAIVLVLPHTKGNRTIRDFKGFKSILKKSMPYALLFLLMMLYTRVDAIMIERISTNGDEAAGFYAQGYRFLDAINMFALLFAGLLLPTFSKLLSEKTELERFLRIGGKLLIPLGFTVGIIGFVNAEAILNWRYEGLVGHDSVLSFQFLMLSFVPMCFTYLYGTLLTANDSLRALNIMAFTALLLNVVLNYVLISAYGFFGAALATLCTSSFAGLIQWVLSRRILEIGVGFNVWIRILLSASITALIAYAVQHYLDQFSLLAKLGIESASALIVLVLLKVFDLKDVKLVLSSRSTT